VWISLPVRVPPLCTPSMVTRLLKKSASLSQIFPLPPRSFSTLDGSPNPFRPITAPFSVGPPLVGPPPPFQVNLPFCLFSLAFASEGWARTGGDNAPPFLVQTYCMLFSTAFHPQSLFFDFLFVANAVLTFSFRYWPHLPSPLFVLEPHSRKLLPWCFLPSSRSKIFRVFPLFPYPLSKTDFSRNCSDAGIFQEGSSFFFLRVPALVPPGACPMFFPQSPQAFFVPFCCCILVRLRFFLVPLVESPPLSWVGNMSFFVFLRSTQT